MRRVVVFVAAVGAAVTTPAAGIPKDAAPAQPKPWAAITVSTPVRDLDDFAPAPFVVSFGLVNDGDKPFDPEVRSSRLLVNGKELEGWPGDTAGPRDARWNSLPPKDGLRFGTDLGKYFEQPGVYKVVWKGKGFESPPVVFRVMPHKRK
jgi:hypothetical protein